ncbi:hypothetical protein F2P56_009739, partial [Juglans regia]
MKYIFFIPHWVPQSSYHLATGTHSFFISIPWVTKVQFGSLFNIDGDREVTDRFCTKFHVRNIWSIMLHPGRNFGISIFSEITTCIMIDFGLAPSYINSVQPSLMRLCFYI